MSPPVIMTDDIYRVIIRIRVSAMTIDICDVCVCVYIGR
jgi:hypothetical protein